jgi:glycosyltransferase involved in cell wall biosynthesis
MNDQIENHVSVDSTSDRPLVTFALFAYNQEKYIREAVDSAFAQSYEPLEIILSDDCSTDRTFEIMQELVAAYKGKHTVIVRQTENNKRPFAHVVEVARMASGRLIVLAAGDDISKNNRVEKIVKTWDGGVCGIHSRYDICDNNGNIVATDRRSEDLFSNKCELRRYFLDADGEVPIVHGATSAYDARLFNLLPEKCSDKILSEDGVLSIFLGAYGKPSLFIDDSLIIYRQHDEAITNVGGKDGYISLKLSRHLINKEKIYSSNIYHRAIFILDNLSAAPDQVRSINASNVQRDVDFHGAKSRELPWSISVAFRAIVIAAEDRKFGGLVPAILGVELGSLYLYFSRNIKIFWQDLLSKPTGVER